MRKASRSGVPPPPLRPWIASPSSGASRSTTVHLNIRWHDLRATFGTWLAVAGKSGPGIRDVLGHTQFSMTDKYLRDANAVRGGQFGAPFPPLPPIRHSGVMTEKSTGNYVEPSAQDPGPVGPSRDGSAPAPPSADDALAFALARAAEAARWDVVAQLAPELGARRMKGPGTSLVERRGCERPRRLRVCTSPIRCPGPVEVESTRREHVAETHGGMTLQNGAARSAIS
jgi:hypothetical protein